jgi:hypothetical protein
MAQLTRACWHFLTADGGAELALCGALLYAAWMRHGLGRWP